MTKLAGSFVINKFLKPTFHKIAGSLNSSVTTNRDQLSTRFQSLTRGIKFTRGVSGINICTRMFLKLAGAQRQNEADVSSKWPMI